MLIRMFALALALTLGVTYAAPVRAAMMDFDTSAPTTDAEIPAFFDLLGDGNSDVHIDANTRNPANGSNALHMATNGLGLQNYFMRTAIVKASVFSAEDVVYSADITWDSDDDIAGLYFRFDGNSNDPHGNTYYNVYINQGGGNNALVLTRVKDGGATELLNTNVNAEAGLSTTGSLNLRVEASGDSISIFIDDLPVPGASPLIDPDPIVGQAINRVGVGTWSQPAYFDNLSMENEIIPEPGSATLLALGLLGLLGFTRRRK